MISASIDTTVWRSGQVCSGKFLKDFVYEGEVIYSPSFDHVCSEILIITVLRSLNAAAHYTLAFLRRPICQYHC